MKSKIHMASMILAAALAVPALAQVAAPKDEPKPAFDPVDVVKLRADADNAAVQAERAAQAERKAAEQAARATERRAMQNRFWAQKPNQPGAGRFVDFDIAIKMEKAPFLGVSVSPPGAAMREQLKLAKGIGLIVDFVEPKSPAEAAGLKQYDILEKIDDQWLVNAQQLSVLVRTHKPDDEINISLLRQGQRTNFKAKLLEKELPPLDEANPWGAPMPPAGDAFPHTGLVPAPQGQGRFEIVTEFAGGGAGNATFLDNGDVNITLSQKDNDKFATVTESKTGKVLYNGALNETTRKNLPPRIAGPLAEVEGAGAVGLPPPQIAVFNRGVGAPGFPDAGEKLKPLSLSFVDDDHILEFSSKGKDKEKKVILTAKTIAGTIVFDGPISTDEERKELPKDIAKKLKSSLLKKMIAAMGTTDLAAGPGGVDVFTVPVAPGGLPGPVRVRLTPPPAANTPPNTGDTDLPPAKK